MGNVISLADYRSSRERLRPARTRSAAFYFDIASPFTYLAAERLERLLPDVSWRPVLSDALEPDLGEEAAWACVARRASDLRLPLEDCLREAHNPRRDRALRAAGEHVVALGAHELPALVVGRGLFCGEHRIAEAVAASRAVLA